MNAPLLASGDSFDSQQDHQTKILAWVYNNVRSYIRGRVLEMTNGNFTIGSIIQEQSTAEKKPRDIYKSNMTPSPTKQIDLSEQTFDTKYTQNFGAYDTVIAIDVLSKGFYSTSELKNARKLLKTRGRLITIVPSLVIFLPDFDMDSEYLNKANLKALKKYFTDCDILLAKCFCLNNNSYCFPYASTGMALLIILRKV